MAKSGKTFTAEEGAIGLGPNGELNVVTKETPRFSLDNIVVTDSEATAETPPRAKPKK